MYNCQFCTEPATNCVTVSVGDPPEKESHHGTQQDHRKVVVVRTCDAHRGRTG